MCVFAVQNFLKDPPFAKIDLISCRNILIYENAFLHKKALTTFHYPLQKKGFLVLGRSETSGVAPVSFTGFTKKTIKYSALSLVERTMLLNARQIILFCCFSNSNTSWIISRIVIKRC